MKRMWPVPAACAADPAALHAPVAAMPARPALQDALTAWLTGNVPDQQVASRSALRRRRCGMTWHGLAMAAYPSPASSASMSRGRGGVLPLWHAQPLCALHGFGAIQMERSQLHAPPVCSNQPTNPTSACSLSAPRHYQLRARSAYPLVHYQASI